MVGCLRYTPLETIKKETVAEVIKLIKNPPSTEFIKELQAKIFEVHGYCKVQNRFISTLYNDKLFQNPMLEYITIKKIDRSHEMRLSISTMRQIKLLNKILYYKIKFIKKRKI